MKNVSEQFLGDMQEILRLCIQCTALGNYDCWCFWSGHVKKFEVYIKEAPYEEDKPDIFFEYAYLDGIHYEHEIVNRFVNMTKELQMRIEQSKVKQ